MEGDLRSPGCTGWVVRTGRNRGGGRGPDQTSRRRRTVSGSGLGTPVVSEGSGERSSPGRTRTVSRKRIKFEKKKRG